jgi:hypothetical protein
MDQEKESAAGRLVGLLFVGRDLAHRAHLRTRSFAEHVALEGFYTGIVPLADVFAEQYQGRYNELLDIPLLDNEFEGEVADVLESQMSWIEDTREEVCPKTETALHNAIDEIVALYQSTIYKLRFLS